MGTLRQALSGEHWLVKRWCLRSVLLEQEFAQPLLGGAPGNACVGLYKDVAYRMC